MLDFATTVLYYGDNLHILRRYLPDAAVDLVYLDPPFNRYHPQRWISVTAGEARPLARRW